MSTNVSNKEMDYYNIQSLTSEPKTEPGDSREYETCTEINKDKDVDKEHRYSDLSKAGVYEGLQNRDTAKDVYDSYVSGRDSEYSVLNSVVDTYDKLEPETIELNVYSEISAPKEYHYSGAEKKGGFLAGTSRKRKVVLLIVVCVLVVTIAVVVGVVVSKQTQEKELVASTSPPATSYPVDGTNATEPVVTSRAPTTHSADGTTVIDDVNRFKREDQIVLKGYETTTAFSDPATTDADPTTTTDFQWPID